MKKRYLVPAIAGLTLLTAGSAFAYGWGGFSGSHNLEPEQIAERYQTMFENQADRLGIEVATIKNYWAEGKNLRDIMAEEGIDEETIENKIREQRSERMRSLLQILVDQGVITQNQADQRMNSAENKPMMPHRIGQMNRMRNCPWAKAD